MTWSVIHFFKDNAVEVVPSKWFRDNKCAWPKTNVTQYIKNEYTPNTKEFDWFKARALSTNIGKLTFFLQNNI